MIAFAASAILLYLFYLPFDAWWYCASSHRRYPCCSCFAPTPLLGRAAHSHDVRGRHGGVRALRRRTSFHFIQVHDVLETGYGEERYPKPRV